MVWLDPGAGGECAGRVEHVATSRREPFESAEELIALLLRARVERAARSHASLDEEN